jgi:hypothetical protein
VWETFTIIIVTNPGRVILDQLPLPVALPVASMTINVGFWDRFTKLFKG